MTHVPIFRIDLFLSYKDSWVRVETESELCKGLTVADFRPKSQQNVQKFNKNCRVMLDINSTLFLQRIKEVFAKFPMKKV